MRESYIYLSCKSQKKNCQKLSIAQRKIFIILAYRLQKTLLSNIKQKTMFVR